MRITSPTSLHKGIARYGGLLLASLATIASGVGNTSAVAPDPSPSPSPQPVCANCKVIGGTAIHQAVSYAYCTEMGKGGVQTAIRTQHQCDKGYYFTRSDWANDGCYSGQYLSSHCPDFTCSYTEPSPAPTPTPAPTE